MSEGETGLPASSPEITMPMDPKGEEAAQGVSPTDETVSAASSPLQDDGGNGPDARHDRPCSYHCEV